MDEIEKRKRNNELHRKRYEREDVKASESERRRTPEQRYSKARFEAKRRNKVFTITFEEYVKIISNKCYYCNRSIAEGAGVGIDRIDNDKGYEPGNCNPCCADCNRRRSKSMSAEEFKLQTELNGYVVKDE